MKKNNISYKTIKNRTFLYKWFILAIFVGLVVISTFLFARRMNDSKSQAPTVLVDDAEYTICGTVAEATILKGCGLPTELSKELAGAFVAYLNYDGECYYTITENKTNVVMFDFKPEPNENVYILSIEDTYYAAIRKDDKGFYGIKDIFYNPDAENYNLDTR